MNGISLFSGAGGLDVGARLAGLKILCCIENDKDSASTLAINNLEQSEIIEQDIQDVNFERWGGVDIIIGGPPCQPFSKNGYWVKNNNRLIADDPRNLLGQYLRAVNEVMPKGFLFENVDSILHPTNLETFKNFITNSELLGYKCTVYRANSADFGVPQKRKRVFVFGIKNGKYEIPFPRPTHSEHNSQNEIFNLLPYAGVGSLIKEYEADQYREVSESTEHGTYYNELKAVPAGKNYIALSQLQGYQGKVFRSGGRFWNFLHKLHPDEPSITIAAQPGPWVGPFHWTNRRLRVPEIAAIQTFPRDYKFYGGRRSIQKQIGNAVPCLLAEKMVSHLLEKFS